MNYVDYASIIIILVSIIFAFYYGFISSIISLSGWVLSAFLTYQFYPIVDSYLSEYIRSRILVIIIGLVGLLIALLIFFRLANSFLYKLIGNLKQSFIDRILGMFFGLLRGFLIISFLFLCFSISLKLIFGKKVEVTQKDYPDIIANASTFQLMKNGADILQQILPSSLNKEISQIYNYISNKDIDESFIQNSINKLTVFASDEEIHDINTMRQDLSTSESQKTIDIKTLEYLLENYKQKMKEGEKMKEGKKMKALDQKELERLENIIKNY